MSQIKAPKRLLTFLVCIQLSIVSFGQDPVLLRGPYLQLGSQTGITIRWRTDIACNSKVELGTTFGTFPMVIADATDTSEHIVRIDGLNPDTKYYYRIVSNDTRLQGGPDNFFTTVPPPNTTRKVRIAVFGDCGRSNAIYQDENLANYRNFLLTNGIDAPDAWLLLGDNAYTAGSDLQYTTKFFNIYESTLLKNHKLYPTIGNHDYGDDETLKTSRSLAYYSNFSTPQNGECGGVPSKKPNFYSFDIGNIHFLSLDSWGIEEDLTDMGTVGNSTLKTWVINDLEANKSKWVIAYWHHPPYTKGSHNSDTEPELVNIRQNFLDLLESRGVDMIICGHSHAYERGYLMKGFRSNWTAFDPQLYAVSTSSATYNSSTTCPYVYNSTPLDHGTVYVVAGSAGASGTPKTYFGSYGFPYAVNDGGVFYIEVEDNRLDAKMLRRNGTVFDQFTIMKDVNKDLSENILNGTPVTLTATWPSSGLYTWNTGSSSRSITLTPPLGTNLYSVTDNFGCVTDRFTINTLATLPVNLTGYNVYLDKNKVNVDWTTASETDSWYFNVERSVDGINFGSIARINAAGTSSRPIKYSSVDSRPLSGLSYYRLVQVDKNSNRKLFEIKKINNPQGKNFDVSVTTVSQLVNISIQANEAGKINLIIYDLSGRTVGTRNWNVAKGLTQVQEQLQAGVYILKFSNKNNEAVVQRILIQ